MNSSIGRRRRQRLLAEEERRLWELVAASVEPLPGHGLVPAAPEVPAGPVVASAPPAPVVSQPPRERVTVRPSPPAKHALYAQPRPIHVKHTRDLAGLAPPVPPPPALATIDDRMRRRLARGSMPIDERIDLHGMTQEAAHSALRHFLVSARARGARMVLVITGKGKTMPGLAAHERGVLRRAVPHWLADASLRAIVVGFEEAHLAHGGAGAIYVRLRRFDREVGR